MEQSSPTPELGIPATAVFYWGEVSRGREPQANRRRALLADGTLLASRNTAEIDWERVDRQPFQTELAAVAGVRVPAPEIAEFLDQVEKLGLLAYVSPVLPPEGLKVHGGVSTFVYARWGEKSVLLEFRPGAQGLDQLKRAWDALLTRHRPVAP